VCFLLLLSIYEVLYLLDFVEFKIPLMTFLKKILEDTIVIKGYLCLSI